MFGITEQILTARRGEMEAKLSLLRGLLDRRGPPAAVLTAPDSVAWLTGGVTSALERGSAVSPLWLVVTADTVAALTTNVERPRIEAEAELGVPLHEASWFEPDGLARLAEDVAGHASDALAWDSSPAFAEDLIALRLRLLEPERERLGRLGVDTAAALEEALRAWQPGELDRGVQAGIAERLERDGCFAACLIVGGDERVERFRHPLANGEPMTRLVMAVVVAERGGLHAAATRFAYAGRLPDSVRAARDAAREVESGVLAATRPGASYGDAVRALDAAYAAAGHPGAWREHYQGGPVGYRQREFELSPAQTGSRWYSTPIEAGHAVAWNPSIAGGGKVEDTYLVEEGGLRRLTDTGAWPAGALLDVTGGGFE